MRFWDNVNRHIELQNTSQEWMALYCGIKPEKFMSWIKNGESPDVYTGLRLASAFGVTIESLFSENDVEHERLNHELMYLLTKLNREQLREVKKHLEKYKK